MTRPRIVVNVYGGIVQGVFASSPELHVVVVDWDTDGLNSPALVDLSLAGRRCSAAVVELAPVPLEELAGSDAEQAIDAACAQGVLLP